MTINMSSLKIVQTNSMIYTILKRNHLYNEVILSPGFFWHIDAVKSRENPAKLFSPKKRPSANPTSP